MEDQIPQPEEVTGELVEEFRPNETINIEIDSHPDIHSLLDKVEKPEYKTIEEDDNDSCDCEFEAKHKTVIIPLKLIEVDENIVPVIIWLNSLDGVQTDFCCEGSYEVDWPNEEFPLYKAENAPYIIFHCTEKDSLLRIMRIFSCLEFGGARVEVDLVSGEDSIRYMAVFKNKHVIEELIAVLEEIEVFDEI